MRISRVSVVVICLLICFCTVAAALAEDTPLQFQWRPAGNMPQALSNTSAIVYRDKIYITGGIGEKNAVTTFIELNPFSMESVRLPEMKTPRFAHASAIINDKLYVFGGMQIVNNHSQYLNSVEAYNFTRRTWEEVAKLPSPRARFSLATCRGKVYLIGGEEEKVPATTRVDIFNPGTGTWERGASLPIPINRHGMASLNDEIYVLGGQNAEGATLNTVYRYNPVSNTWATLAPMKAPRKNFAAARIGSHIVVAGGWEQRGSVKTFFQTAEMYEPVLKKWSSAGKLIRQRDGARAVAIHGKVYVIGGFDGTSLLSSIEEGGWISGESNWRLDESMKMNLVSYVVDETPLKDISMKESPSLELTPYYQADITNMILQNLLNLGFPMPRMEFAHKLNFYVKFFEYPRTLNHQISSQKALNTLLVLQTGQGKHMRNYLKERLNINARKGIIATSGTSFSLENPFPPLKVPVFPVKVNGECLSPQEFFDRNIPFGAIYLNPVAAIDRRLSLDEQAKVSTRGVIAFHREILKLYRATYREIPVSRTTSTFFFVDDTARDLHKSSRDFIRIIRVPKDPLVFANFRELPMPQDPEHIFLTGLLILYEDVYLADETNSLYTQDAIDKLSTVNSPARSRLFEVGSVLTTAK